MRCRAALERMASLPDEERLEKEPELSSHLAECAGCAAAWREHRALLGLLRAPGEEPVFGDLSPAVLARIDAGATGPRRRWQWAAAAALAVAALAMGYLFGQMSAEAAPPADAMAATYQAALTGQAGSSTYLAYLEAGSTASARSTP